jgi:hypothetical protein
MGESTSASASLMVSSDFEERYGYFTSVYLLAIAKWSECYCD